MLRCSNPRHRRLLNRGSGFDIEDGDRAVLLKSALPVALLLAAGDAASACVASPETIHNREIALIYNHEAPMQIRIASVMVENQETALHFYTTILGFVKSKDTSMGQYRWLTVSSPEG